MNDDLADAALSPGCLGTGSSGGVGALWSYGGADIGGRVQPVLVVADAVTTKAPG